MDVHRHMAHPWAAASRVNAECVIGLQPASRLLIADVNVVHCPGHLTTTEMWVVTTIEMWVAASSPGSCLTCSFTSSHGVIVSHIRPPGVNKQAFHNTCQEAGLS